MCVSKHQSIGAEVVTHYLGSNMPTLEDHDDDDSDDELLEMHNYHVDFLSPPPSQCCFQSSLVKQQHLP